ncbi:glyoxylase-like metal-dependent hydrolase (beta-lactamase superfamily II) [Pseudomonas duriflava]|uniref:Glyoxylase-like metal-dependent hydrolase (Beta-lactamase superfamily II) n=1 Tax=Pseudomonas duriflava TaxID=459528 RepID=A0A562QPJ2_9PSED|nr:MBL fold metallo-hydrolase [Pseudomonas duriflava]TWI58678.1 glyoxylase-like metal-dependent hydrolase (beta-lactamase superfamily II) [Pseudomonas duriflava]
MQPHVTTFFDDATHTFSYVVTDPATRQCALIDSVLDYEQASGHIATTSADRMVNYIQANGLSVQWLLETHVHADHLSAAAYLRRRVGGTLAIGEHIRDVQGAFSRLLNIEAERLAQEAPFGHLFRDGERFSIGSLEGFALHTPGHTPACMTYVIGDAGFVGDTLFMPDYGTARCDFPGGDARQLYRSIQKIFQLPDETRLFMCHDYKAPGRDEYRNETTVGQERTYNVHVHEGVTEDGFVAMRTARDATLKMPALILPSVQVNIRAGELPPPESNGIHYLKIPLNAV